MQATILEVTLDDDLLASLRSRVNKGESQSVNDLIQADLRYAAEMAGTDGDFLASVVQAYDEMEADPNLGVPIEDIMRRYGMQIPADRQQIS